MEDLNTTEAPEAVAPEAEAVTTDAPEAAAEPAAEDPQPDPELTAAAEIVEPVGQAIEHDKPLVDFVPIPEAREMFKGNPGLAVVKAITDDGKLIWLGRDGTTASAE